MNPQTFDCILVNSPKEPKLTRVRENLNGETTGRTSVFCPSPCLHLHGKRAFCMHAASSAACMYVLFFVHAIWCQPMLCAWSPQMQIRPSIYRIQDCGESVAARRIDLRSSSRGEREVLGKIMEILAAGISTKFTRKEKKCSEVQCIGSTYFWLIVLPSFLRISSEFSKLYL